jgi:hypothetical protein
LITLDYQQRLICNGLETVTDGSYEPLQMTFSVVVVGYFFFWTGTTADNLLSHHEYSGTPENYHRFNLYGGTSTNVLMMWFNKL